MKLKTLVNNIRQVDPFIYDCGSLGLAVYELKRRGVNRTSPGQIFKIAEEITNFIARNRDKDVDAICKRRQSYLKEKESKSKERR